MLINVSEITDHAFLMQFENKQTMNYYHRLRQTLMYNMVPQKGHLSCVKSFYYKRAIDCELVKQSHDRVIQISLLSPSGQHAFFYKNNFIRTTRLKFGQKLKVPILKPLKPSRKNSYTKP